MQELRCAAAVSQDKEMLNTYYQERDNPKLIRPDTGEEFDNPYVDLHLVACLSIPRFSYLNECKPWELMNMAKTANEKGIVPRSVGKVQNFLTLYGGQASKLSEQSGLDIKEAEEVIKGYFKKFYGLARWLNKMGTLARYQKWVTDPIGRKYFVGEDNAKGSSDENTSVRKGCNAVIS